MSGSAGTFQQILVVVVTHLPMHLARALVFDSTSTDQSVLVT